MLYLYYRTTFVPVRKYISLPLEINKHYMAIKRFGVSLEENLLESLDKYVDENGFANRSQAIRFLIEKNVAERKWQYYYYHVRPGEESDSFQDCRYRARLSGRDTLVFPVLYQSAFLSAHRNCDGHGSPFDGIGR